MKKLIALLLVLVLIPVAALADTGVRFDCYEEINADGVEHLLVSYGLDEEWSSTLSSALSEVLKNCSFSLQVQEDALRLSCSMAETPVVTVDAAWNEETLYLQSNLIPDLTLSLQLPQYQNMMNGFDLDECLDTFESYLSAFLTGLDTTQEIGYFIGDAYTGGVERKTVTLDDRMLYLMAEAVLGEIEAALPSEMNVTLTKMLRDTMLEDALRNQGKLVMSEVWDSEGEIVGFSVTLCSADETLATLSVGNQADGFKAVLAYRYNGCMYYDAAELTVTSDDAKLEVKSYYTMGNDGFAAVSADESTLWNMLTAYACMPDDDTLTLNLMNQSANLTLGTDISISVEDERIICKSVDWYGAERQTVDTQYCIITECERFEPLVPSKVTLDMAKLDTDSESVTTLTDSLNQGVQNIAIQLFKSVPVDALIKLYTLWN